MSIPATTIQQFDCDPAIDSLGPKWTAWIKRLEQFFASNKMTDDTQKVNSLFFLAGDRVYQIHETLSEVAVDASINTEYGKAKAKLNAYFSPSRNPVFEIFNFMQAKQEANETIYQFVSRLRILSEFCEFGDSVNKWIIAKVVHSCRSEELRREYLAKPKLTYKEMVDMGQNHDNVEGQALRIEGKVEVKQEAVYQIKPKPKYNAKSRNSGQNSSSNRPSNTPGQARNTSNQGQQSASPSTPKNQLYCYNCGGDYPHNEPCPAIGKTCFHCNKLNHVASVCKSKSSTRPAQVNRIAQNSVSFSDENRNYVFGVASQDRVQPIIPVTIANTPLKLSIDTLSSINVIDEATYAKIQPRPTLSEPKTPAFAYGSTTPISFLGEFFSTIRVGRKIQRATFVVAKGNYGSLLGFPTARLLGVDPVSQIMENHVYTVSNLDSKAKQLDYYKAKYPSVFSDKIGELKGFELELHIDESVKPVQSRPRNTPYHLREAIERDIKFMLDNEIIEEVKNEPTGWLSETVNRPKPNGEVRVCVDMRCANTAISCEKHEMPNADDILFKINGMKFFGTVDLKHAFKQVKLGKKSRPISRFRTHVGIFQYRRLFFGVNSAPEIFNKLIRNLLEGIQFQVNATDDILVMGKTLEEFESTMEAVLQRLADAGLTVNPAKCHFGLRKVTFFGMVISEDGVSLNDEKTRALREAKVPTSADELHSFLGLTVYASKWIERLAIISDPLWQLIKKGVRWHWTAEHQSCFDLVKKAVVQSIGFFDMSWDTEVHVDASPVGAAGILCQKNKDGAQKVIKYISRSFTDTERRYSQIEKEALAFVWALERLEPYLIGQHFTVFTDNKAVELIFKNPLSKPPARILRWALRVSSFNYTIVHRPGLGNIADFLSRHPLDAPEADKKMYAEDYVNMLVSYSMPCAMPRDLVLKETLSDSCLIELTKMIRANKLNTNANDEVRKFSKVFDELSVSDEGFIIRDRRLVLPSSLRLQAIRLAHEGHQGLRKTKELLRSKVWFPNMDLLTENYYDQCSCQAESKQTHITPMSMTEMPRAPWTEIAIDFFGPFDDVCLMVTYCEYSRFVFVEIVPVNYDNKIVTDRLESSFSIYGVPEIVKTDNGTPFQSAGFKDFALKMGFIHRKVTPYWPRANGEVESFMKNLGKVLRTAKLDNVSWRLRLREFLRAYRSTPHSTTKVAPVDLFLRNGNTSRLPSSRRFQPSDIDMFARENDTGRKAAMKAEADKRLRTKDHSFKVGDIVIAKQRKLNKSSTKFDPTPYTIIKVKGNMIVGQNENRQLCRNASFFAHYKSAPPALTVELFQNPVVVVENQEEQPEEEAVNLDPPQGDHSDQSSDEHFVDAQAESEEEAKQPRRSTREKSAPESYKESIYRTKNKSNSPNAKEKKKEKLRKRSAGIVHILQDNEESIN